MRKSFSAFALVLVAPLISEVLPGSAPLSHLGILPFVFLIYGLGALLIRELAVLSRRGWPCILLLGTAYGLIEEGLALQSLFNPALYRAADWGGRAFGINGVYAEAALTIHAVWTAAIPILVCNLMFPMYKGEPYLRRRGLVITGSWYLIGVMLLGALTRISIAPGYSASRALLVGAAILAIMLGLAALLLLPRAARRELRNISAPKPLTVLLVIFMAALLWHFLLAVLWRMAPGVARFPAVMGVMLGALTVLAAVLCIVGQWASTGNWNELHGLALAVGAIGAHSLVGGAILAHTYADRVGIAVLGTLFLSLLTWRVFQRRCVAE